MEDNFLGLLNYMANLGQLIDLGFNMSQTSNDTLMKTLQEQNEKYLKTIIKNQEKIIELLEEKQGMLDERSRFDCKSNR